MSRKQLWPPKEWTRCAMCDEWYDPNRDRATMHLHPEPQGGPARAIWLASRLPYERWIVETGEGMAWARRKTR